jgi:hypothetical protein
MDKVIFSGIKGVNELVSPELLEANEVPYFINGVLKKSGSGLNAKKRGVWRRNTSYTAAGASITGLKQLLDGIGNPYWCAYAGTKLQAYNSGWVDVKTGLTTGLNFKFVRYNDYNIITNGVDSLFTIGGTAFANVRSLEITRPDVSNICTQHIQGSFGLLDASSQYRYILVYASDELDYSPPSIPFTHYESNLRNSTNATEKALYLYGLPVSTDARVTKRYLFRTEGNGETYYLRKILDNVATDFEDSAADTDLDYSMSITYINVPLFSEHIAVHRDRLFLANLKYNDLNVYEPVHEKSKGSTTTKTYYDSTSSIYEDGEVFSVGNHSVGSATGSLEPNTIYKYRIEFLDVYGRRTGYREITYTTEVTSYDYYTLVHIPEAIIGSSDKPNPECYKKRLWRTDQGGIDFYLLDEIVDDSSDPTGTGIGIVHSYQDSTTDAALVTHEAWTAIGTSQQITNEVALAFSEVGTPTAIPLENFREIFADEGGEITGIFDDVNGLLIFKDRAIFKIYTDGTPTNWRLVKLVDGIGCSDSNSITRVDNTYIFKDKNRIYEFTGGQLKEISQKFRTSIGRILTVKEAIVNNEWYWILCTISGYTVVYVYDRMLETWYTFTKAGGECLTFNKYGPDYSADSDVYTNYGAYIVNYYTSSTVETETGVNADVEMKVYSKYFRFPDSITMARLRKLFINFYGTTGKATSFQIYNPEEDSAHTYTTTAVAGWQTGRSDVAYTFPKSRIMQFKISGVGVDEFGTARVDYRIIREGYGG